MSHTILVFTLHVVVACEVPLAAFDADGWNLPVQIANTTIPYPFTFLQAMLLSIGIIYLILLAMIGLTLLLSSKDENAIPCVDCTCAYIGVWRGFKKIGVKVSVFKTFYNLTSYAVSVVMSFCLWHFEGVKLGSLVCTTVNGIIIGNSARYWKSISIFQINSA